MLNKTVSSTCEDTPPGSDDGLEVGELAWRLRQQQLQAAFGLFALRCRDRQDLLAEVVETAACGMKTDFSKLLVPDPDQPGMLIVQAGVGWHDGVVGVARIGADTASPAGYALQTREAVISNHLENEKRFRTPDLFVEHGIKRALNVPVNDGMKPYGVLEVDSTRAGRFAPDDVAFLEGLANVLAVALERLKTRQDLEAAIERETILAHEMRHRVKNVFSVVNGLITMSEREARQSGDPESGLPLLRERVLALSRSAEIGLASESERPSEQKVNPVALSRSVLAPFSGRFDVEGPALALPGELITPLALILHELATNSIKHGALGASSGRIDLCWYESAGEVAFKWIESGGPELEGEPTEAGYGTRMLSGIIASAGGAMETAWSSTGMRTTVRLPV